MAQVKITVRRNGPYRVEAPEGTAAPVGSVIFPLMRPV